MNLTGKNEMAHNIKPSSLMESGKNYYRELDGLRAIAVILVILFHLDVSAVSGGFVGVDVFFVISGYLMTTIILEEIKLKGTVAFKEFFVRRFKRLYPALITTLFLSFLVAFFLMSAQDLQKFGGSVVSSMFGISNFYFWSQSGYFDVAATLKPALHTWSLSVEAQFYIFWVILIALAVIKLNIKPYIVVLGIGLCSLILNIFFETSINTATQFFLIPFRLYEFAIGAAVFFLMRLKPSSKIYADLVVFLGLALIFYSAFTFTNQIRFPSYNALIPCIGTALIIWSANRSSVFSFLFRLKFVIYLGLISYSLYLVHWPIIVFFKYQNYGDLDIKDKLLIFFFSVLLATLIYRFIESPIRRFNLKNNSFQFFSSFAVISILVFVPAAGAWENSGWAWRHPEGVDDISNKTSESLKYRNIRDAACSFTNFDNFSKEKCVYPEKNKVNVLVLGDSVADYAWHGLHKNLPADRYNILQLTPSNCRPGVNWGEGYCRQSNDYIFKHILESDIDLTVIASLGPELENFKATLDFFAKNNKKVLVVGFPFIFKERLPDILRKTTPLPKNESEINIAASKGLIDPMKKISNDLKNIVIPRGVAYYDIQEQLCRIPDDYGTCNFIVDGGLITADNVHFTPNASTQIFSELGKRIMREFP